MTDERDSARPAAGHGGISPVAGITLLSLTIALVAIGAVLFFGGGDFARIVWGLPGVSGLWALGFSMAGYPITRRHPANPVGWCLMVAGMAAGVNHLGLGLGVNTDTADLGGLLMGAVNAWVVSVAALSSAVVFFPSGSPPSRWWWVQLGLLWGSGAFMYFADDAGAGLVGLPGWLEPIGVPMDVVFQLSLAAGCFSLLVRWRRSGSLERLQLKWVAYGVTLVGVTALIVELGVDNLAPDLYLPGTVVLSIVILAVPATIGVAMLRHRLYDIDLIVNRTLVYGALTLLLAGTYLGSVVSLQYAFRALTGEDSQLAVVASTLAIAALFNPLRHRLQSFIDRRFYRQKYDARKTLDEFSTRLRDQTNLEELGGELVEVVGETVRPAHVSLWLREKG